MTLSSSWCRRCGEMRALRAVYRVVAERATMIELACCGAHRRFLLEDDVLEDARGYLLRWSGAGQPWTWRDLPGVTHAIDVRIGPNYFARCDGVERRERVRPEWSRVVRDDGVTANVLTLRRRCQRCDQRWTTHLSEGALEAASSYVDVIARAAAAMYPCPCGAS